MNGMSTAENDLTPSSVKAGTCLSLWVHPWPMGAFATAGAVEARPQPGPVRTRRSLLLVEG